MEHKHTYDAKGKQLCCTQQEKIYTNAGASSLLEDGHSKIDGHNHSEHSDEDGHDHSKGNDSVVKNVFTSNDFTMFITYCYCI
jgi:Cd2+/Zn2+-exporting ATPase